MVEEENDNKSICSSSTSSSERNLENFDDARDILNKLVKAKRVYVVGSIGSVRKTVANFKVGFNKDGVALLNKCGKKFVEESGRL